MAAWHSLDLTNFDLVPATRTARRVSESVAERGVAIARDAAYISVGLAVLTFKRAETQRREFERALRR